MKFLYLITQNYATGYDTYDSAVVCAETSDHAKTIHPDGSSKYDTKKDKWYREYANQKRDYYYTGEWCGSAQSVDCALLGIAQDGLGIGVVLASYSAG